MKLQKIIILISLLSIALFSIAQDNDYLGKFRQMALDHEQDVRSSKSNLDAALQLERAAKSDFYPKILFDGNYNYLGRTVVVDDIIGFNNFYALNLTLAQPIYAGGLIKNTYEAFKIETQLANSNVNYVSQNVLLKLDQLYFNAVSKKEEYNIIQQYRDYVREFVRVIRAKVDAEVVSVNDLYMAEVRLNDADFQLLQSERSFNISIMRLNRQIGVAINEQTEVEDSLSVSISDLDQNARVDNALTNRPVVKIREKDVSLSERKTKITQAKYNPKLSFRFNGFYGTDFPILNNVSVGDYTLNATLIAPIFYWNKRRFEVKADQMKIRESNFQLEKIREVVSLEVNEAFYSLQESIKQVDLTRNSLEKADQNLTVVLNRYNEGLVNVINVLDAQIYWQETYINYVAAKFNFNASKSYYLRSLGELTP